MIIIFDRRQNVPGKKVGPSKETEKMSKNYYSNNEQIPEAYVRLAQALDEGPLTAPKSEGDFSRAFLKYLSLLYSPQEAEIAGLLKMGMKFTSAADIANRLGKTEEEIRKILDPLAERGKVIGMGGMYVLPPIAMVLNYHQFNEETGQDDIQAAELYQQYFIKDGYYKYYESSEKGTQIMRVIPVQKTLHPGQDILDTEDAHRIIESVEELRLVSCPCRTRTEKLGIRECKDRFPIGNCIMMDNSARYFAHLGIGKAVSADEAKTYFDEMQALGLVGTTDNYDAGGHTVICLCCDCCCSQLRGRTRWDNPEAVAPSNFVAEAGEDCIMCGECVERCFFKAIELDEDAGSAVVSEERCMGCGVCTLACEHGAMRLKRVERHKPFPGPRELFKKIAIENRDKEA